MDILPSVSIIIVNYNVKDFLSQCLSSIFNSQTNFPFEIIVVDNSSTDGSVEFIRRHFSSVKVLPLEKNFGFGFANNKGFELSRGKYLLLLNPDTVLQENTLQVMFDYLENNPEVGIAGCKVLNPDGSLQLACRRGFPTPWVAFSKLFGLQRLFPKSKLFGRYNLTYLDPNEFAFVDAISGSFMFVRRQVFEQLNGFDTDFFMYGEDIDFCYRAKQIGWKIAYVPTTSIIHYKGQSSKRSIIDSTYHFFKSMEIFSLKHFGKAKLFIWFIRLGISLKQFFTRISKYRTELGIMLLDIAFANFSLLLASYIRFGNPLSFPDYAYPTVFIVLTLVVFLSMVISGEYFESKHSFWKATFALLIAFFVLSSLTYFFKDFAFSRGVLLLTIGFTLVLTNLSRMIFNLKKKIEFPRKIAFVGYNQNTELLIESLENSHSTDYEVVGFFNFSENVQGNNKIPFLGKLDELPEVVEMTKISEIIVTDDKISKIEILKYLQKIEKQNVKIFYAQGYEDIVASELISSLTRGENLLENYNLALFRFRFYKRVFDISFLLVLFTIGFPFLFLLFDKSKRNLKYFAKILIGKMTFVGLDKEYRQIYTKEPLITIAEANSYAVYSQKTKEKLNHFYLQNYSPLLDLEIILKYKRGENGKTTNKVSS